MSLYIKDETALLELAHALPLLKRAAYRPVGNLAVECWITREPVPWHQRTSGEHLRPAVGDRWGSLFDSAWFRFEGEVPAVAANQHLVAEIDLNGELCVFDVHGRPQRGLTCEASTFDYRLGRPGKTLFTIARSAEPGKVIELWADAGCNDLFGNLVNNGSLKSAGLLVQIDELVALYYDLEVVHDWLAANDRTNPDYGRVLDAAVKTVMALAAALTAGADSGPAAASATGAAAHDGGPGAAAGLAGGDGIAAAVIKARAFLASVMDGSSRRQLVVDSIGHAHIDLAWLWPLRETRRKVVRTFATVVAAMRDYDDYVFAMSQPQMYQWLKEDQPELYAQVKVLVAAGRIEPQGAMWVEADLNVSGGEALIRQILYGKRFFRDEFGVEPDYLWEPDAFGYPASIPQLLAKSGIRYFGSQKMSWNMVNEFPYHSFIWRGIDGSAVASHFFPEDTYNGPALPRSVAKIERSYKQRDVSNHALMVFGIGDGGGGPGEEHLERIRRLSALPGMPLVRQRRVGEFFDEWAGDTARFPTWRGELYLERHQGTLTSHHAAKRDNRAMEQVLHDLEFVATLAAKGTQSDGAVRGTAGRSAAAPYPRADLERIWKETLLYQFHDILPGSSIKRVYDENNLRYAELRAEAETLWHAAAAAVAAAVDTQGMEQPVVFFNSLSWDRVEWLSVGKVRRRVVVPALGYQAVDAAAGDVSAADGASFGVASTTPRLSADELGLENDMLRVRFAADGSIESLFDKRQHVEMIRPGSGANRYAVYPDAGDAWDFVPHYRDMPVTYFRLQSVRVESAADRVSVHQQYRHRTSSLDVCISLTDGSPRLDFACTVNWNDPQCLLKVEFPVAVETDHAMCGIQFGAVARPTHDNTGWDAAKDEVAAHGWVDLADATHGLALLTVAKYGHRVKGAVLELTLLRSPRYPGGVVTDPSAADFRENTYIDIGTHDTRYALLPHAGDFAQAGVPRAAAELNNPIRSIAAPADNTGRLPTELSFVQVSDPAVIIEAVKMAEDSSATVIRLYESTGGRRQVSAKFAGRPTAVALTNLMEEGPQSAELVVDTIDLDFGPFEIKTLRVEGMAQYE